MTSYYAGIDVSSKEVSIAIVDLRGKRVFETSCETEPEVISNTLKNANFPIEKIGLESGNLSFWLLEHLKSMGWPAICVESRQMATLIALKVNKTDKNDARIIAEAMRCNLYQEVHHKAKHAIEVGIQLGVRRNLVNIRTQMKNSMRGHLKAYGIRLGKVSHKEFPKRMFESLEGLDESVQMTLKAHLHSFETVCLNIDLIEEEIGKLQITDPILPLLQTIPGVGPLTALTFKAVIDDPLRFRNPRDIGAYLGLTPRQYSSGETMTQGRISKCGSQELRFLLVECANALLTRTKSWCKLKAWGLKIMKKHGSKKAEIAVARKLSIIMLMMWQNKKPFVWGRKEDQKLKKDPGRPGKAQR